MLVGSSMAATIDVQLESTQVRGTIICMLYNSANNFGDLREPYRQQSFVLNETNQYRLTDIPAGTYALLVFLDENNNGFLDKNFIGIPRESVAFSSGYRPKGPPSFKRAQFNLSPNEAHTERIMLEPVLGEGGRIGVGLGLIGRSSPYRDYNGNVTQVIPAITYINDRIQILGPNVGIGLLGSDKNRLAATVSYRMGVYEEKDSDFLAGMGDRDNTVMAGLRLQSELPGGLEASLAYQHDMLDRIGGGQAQASLGKTFQWSNARISPSVGMNWTSKEISSYDFGVTAAQARAGRPAYQAGDSWNPELGLGTFVELNRNWLVVGRLGMEFLDDNLRQSPIVSEDHVITGFIAINYVF